MRRILLAAIFSDEASCLLLLTSAVRSEISDHRETECAYLIMEAG